MRLPSKSTQARIVVWLCLLCASCSKDKRHGDPDEPVPPPIAKPTEEGTSSPPTGESPETPPTSSNPEKNCHQIAQGQKIEPFENSHLQASACIDLARKSNCPLTKEFLTRCLSRYGRDSSEIEARLKRICETESSQQPFCQKVQPK